MKILLGISISSKNLKFLNRFLNSLQELEIPSSYNVKFVFIIEKKNFIYSNMIKRKFFKEKIQILLTKKRGIPQSRNLFLRYIRSNNSKYSGFLDDDCIISKKWLKNMIKFIKKTDTDIVGGPQFHLVRNNFYLSLFELIEPNRNHGQEVDWVATNNSFFKSIILKKNNIVFDEKMKNIGGSDQLFFKNLNRIQFKCKWNLESPVIENIQTDRENIQWFLKRNLRYGYSGNYIDKKIYGPKLGTIINFLKLCYLLIVSIIFFLLIIRKKNYFKSIFYLCRSAGRFMGFINYIPKKYI